MIGQILNGEWELVSHIDRSNFGDVYEGRHVSTGDPCAVKLLRSAQSNADHLADFEVEGDLLEMLASCSNVIDIFGRGQHKVTATISGPAGEQPYEIVIPFIVLELADVCLADLIARRHELPWPDRLSLFREVVKGVHQMHQHRVVNRDVKSDNVLVIEVSPKQIDAKIGDLGRSSDTRATGRVAASIYDFMRGDPAFSAPELIWGLGNAHPDTARLADLYLLGSVLFEFGAGVGLTAMAVPNPIGVVHAVAALSGADRMREYEANVPQLRQALGVAYTQFEAELPGPVRQPAMQLLRRLTEAAPEEREPKTISGRPLAVKWDLQWVLRKVDKLLLLLAAEERKRVDRERKRERRSKYATPSGSGTAR